MGLPRNQKDLKHFGLKRATGYMDLDKIALYRGEQDPVVLHWTVSSLVLLPGFLPPQLDVDPNVNHPLFGCLEELLDLGGSRF